MRDQKKAEAVAQEHMQLLAPLLAEGLDPAKMKQLKTQICAQTGISDRTLRRYLAHYRDGGFDALKPKGKCRDSQEAIPERWSRGTRDWTRINQVALNPTDEMRNVSKEKKRQLP